MPTPSAEPAPASPASIRLSTDRATMARIDAVARGLVAAFQDADPVLTAAALRRAADILLRDRVRGTEAEE